MKPLPVDTILKTSARAPWIFIGLIIEIGLTMAVLLNVGAIISDHLALTSTQTGVPESELAVIQSISTKIGERKGNSESALAALRNTPGVTAAAMGDIPLWDVRQVPIGKFSDGKNPATNAYMFIGSQGLVGAFALHYVEGRPISDLEIPDVSAISQSTVFPVVLTQALAKRIFGQENVLGKTFYIGSQPARIVGVVDHLRGAITGKVDDDYSFVIQYRIGHAQDLGGGFVIRANAANLHQVMTAAAEAMHRANPNHVQQKVQTMADLRADYFGDRTSTAWLLIGLAVILIAIMVGGIVGLGIYWVHQRRTEVGVRRALGATRLDIVLYFLIENLLVMLAGAVIGSVVVLVLSAYLKQHYEVPRVDLVTLATAFLMLTGLGQAAAFWPAFRASRMSPSWAINGC